MGGTQGAQVGFRLSASGCRIGSCGTLGAGPFGEFRAGAWEFVDEVGLGPECCLYMVPISLIIFFRVKVTCHKIEIYFLWKTLGE